MSEFEARLDRIQKDIEEGTINRDGGCERLALRAWKGFGPSDYGATYKAQDIIDGMKSRGYELKLIDESEMAYEFEVSKLPKDRRGMRLILQPKTKEDVTEGLTYLIKAMERNAKEVPEKVKITAGPPADYDFGVEFKIEWE